MLWRHGYLACIALINVRCWAPLLIQRAAAILAVWARQGFLWGFWTALTGASATSGHACVFAALLAARGSAAAFHECCMNLQHCCLHKAMLLLTSQLDGLQGLWQHHLGTCGCQGGLLAAQGGVPGCSSSACVPSMLSISKLQAGAFQSPSHCRLTSMLNLCWQQQLCARGHTPGT